MTLDRKAEFAVYRELWKQPSQAHAEVFLGYPGWPSAGFAVMGDFSGIQNFVFRPVPGAGGAARRLRSRSFRVSAYSEMIMQWCTQRLAQGQPRILYSAGGKFLMGVSAFEDFEAELAKMQRELDEWAWQNFGGELVFHLVSAPLESNGIPHAALQSMMQASRRQPLAQALLSPGGWSENEFFQAAASGDGKCDACGMTRQLNKNADNEEICDGCIKDEGIGKKLPRSRFAHILPGASGDLSVLGTGLELCERKSGDSEGEWLALGAAAEGARPWYLLRHLPAERDRALTFEDIAAISPGTRKWLGYLRIDGDGAGQQFTDLQGAPQRTWALSRLLNLFFADTANRFISSEFQNIYPVYGGGDDLFVVGPWHQVLIFASKLREELRSVAGEDLTFSAGVSLSKPREHVLTQANLALRELDSAKRVAGYGRHCGRDQIRALGVTADWPTFTKLLDTAREVTEWVEKKEIPSSFLHQLLQLHNAWRQCHKRSDGKITARLVRFKPLLYYQIERNLKPGEARDWAHSLLREGSLWPWVDFVARYAMIARSRQDKE
jgi:CRISPR-associated protein Cas10/Csm1 subtype III-A